jgi:glycosyltransferase involved in cell wall biosynthesis
VITVVIPVGPYPANKRWLNEAITSVVDQLGYGDELLLVDDYADIKNTDHRIIKNPWRLGLVASFNIGVMSASNERSIMLGSDDKLLPGALDACKATFLKYNNFKAYYYMKVKYDNGELQDLPCHAAMVTKTLWRHTGGFAPEMAIGAVDSMFVSIMLGAKGAAGKLIAVESPGPLYWVRRHPEQDTAYRGSYQDAIFQIRNILTRDWVKPEWTH